MPKRKSAPMPLDILRAKTAKHASDIIALKARVVDAEQRLAKVETALGTIGKGDLPANMESEDPRMDERPGEGEE